MHAGGINVSGGMIATKNSNGTTLTCISTGGPVTNVIWTRDSEPVLKGNITTSLDNRTTAQYNHTLTLDELQEGIYNCTVFSNQLVASAQEMLKSLNQNQNRNQKNNASNGEGGKSVYGAVAIFPTLLLLIAIIAVCLKRET